MPKDQLVQLASQVLPRIRDLPGLRTKSSSALTVSKAQKKSRFVRLGRMHSLPVDLAIWWDNTVGWKGGLYWYGFGSTRRRDLEPLASYTEGKRAVADRFYDYKNEPKRPATVAERGKTVFEGADSEFYIGVYQNSLPTVVEIASFCRDLVQGVDEKEGIRNGEAEADLLGAKGVEERKRIVSHSRWERRLKIADAVKGNPPYECEVCKEQLGSKYGPDIGDTYAEAHHKIPLHTLKGKKVIITKPEDLVCVCANCHRMLHRLIGRDKRMDGVDAIKELTSRVDLAKKAGTWAI